jgi:hypothetical protein
MEKVLSLENANQSHSGRLRRRSRWRRLPALIAFAALTTLSGFVVRGYIAETRQIAVCRHCARIEERRQWTILGRTFEIAHGEPSTHGRRVWNEQIKHRNVPCHHKWALFADTPQVDIVAGLWLPESRGDKVDERFKSLFERPRR